jgi:hypothetical protein
MSDVEQQEVVENFGKDETDVRLLLASDIAAEGINLHYLCHRLVHFDIPWSLMLFQQRNGRIDRYGQEQRPQIRYMVTRTGNVDIRGDLRILDVLIRKEQQAEENIDDPASLMGVYDVEEEEKITAGAMESGTAPEAFDEDLSREVDVMELLLGHGDEEPADDQERTADAVSLFGGDYDYMETALRHLREQEEQTLDTTLQPDDHRVRITATDDIKKRFKRLPDEVWPEDGVFHLSSDPDAVQAAIKQSRQEEHAWPRTQYLWEQHPLMQWVDDKVVASFHRSEAPILTLPSLSADESIVICSGNIPNRKGQSVVNEWIGVRFHGSSAPDVIPFRSVVEQTGLSEDKLPNRAAAVDTDALQDQIPEAVEAARTWMLRRRSEVEAILNEKLQTQLDRLEQLKARHEQQLEMQFAQSDRPEAIIEGQKQKRQREIDRIFEDFFEWVENTMTTEDQAYIQVVAVLTGTN